MAKYRKGTTIFQIFKLIINSIIFHENHLFLPSMNSVLSWFCQNGAHVLSIHVSNYFKLHLSLKIQFWPNLIGLLCFLSFLNIFVTRTCAFFVFSDSQHVYVTSEQMHNKYTYARCTHAHSHATIERQQSIKRRRIPFYNSKM